MLHPDTLNNSGDDALAKNHLISIMMFGILFLNHYFSFSSRHSHSYIPPTMQTIAHHEMAGYMSLLVLGNGID
jgi:hypothetical protein